MTQNPPIHDLVVELNTRMFVSRLKPTHVCQTAGVHPSTWTRWVDGAEPNTGTIRRMNEAIDQMLAKRLETAGHPTAAGAAEPGKEA